MDKIEASDILKKKLDIYRLRSYKDLLYLIDAQDTFEVKASSGVIYQLEFQAIWDDKKNENLRVMGSIDSGGIRSFFPLTNDFILDPNDSFVGE